MDRLFQMKVALGGGLIYEEGKGRGTVALGPLSQCRPPDPGSHAASLKLVQLSRSCRAWVSQGRCFSNLSLGFEGRTRILQSKKKEFAFSRSLPYSLQPNINFQPVWGLLMWSFKVI